MNIELSKRVVDIAKTLSVKRPVRDTLSTLLDRAVDVDDPLGNKLGGGYIFNVINGVAVDICVMVDSHVPLVKCAICYDTKAITVYEPCMDCFGAKDGCVVCNGVGEFKTLIPCQDCKTEK